MYYFIYCQALRSVRARRDSENSSAGVNDDRGTGVQGDEITSSGGDVASESSLPEIQVGLSFCICIFSTVNV